MMRLRKGKIGFNRKGAETQRLFFVVSKLVNISLVLAALDLKYSAFDQRYKLTGYHSLQSHTHTIQLWIFSTPPRLCGNKNKQPAIT